jgi:hypothetical protein
VRQAIACPSDPSVDASKRSLRRIELGNADLASNESVSSRSIAGTDALLTEAGEPLDLLEDEEAPSLNGRRSILTVSLGGCTTRPPPRPGRRSAAPCGEVSARSRSLRRQSPHDSVIQPGLRVSGGGWRHDRRVPRCATTHDTVANWPKRTLLSGGHLTGKRVRRGGLDGRGAAIGRFVT